MFLKITGFSQTGSFIEDKLIRYIKTNKINNIMILPTYYADKIGYLTRKKFIGVPMEKYLMKDLIIFSCFKKLNFYKNDGVNFVLIDEQYLNPKEIDLNKKQMVFKKGNFSLFKL